MRILRLFLVLLLFAFMRTNLPAAIQIFGVEDTPDFHSISKIQLKENEAAVWYLYHAGWAVKTANTFMIFDYVPDGFLDSGILRNENVYAKILDWRALSISQKESRLDALAPEEFGNGEWTRHRQAEIYQGDDLFLYINGGAEIYHEYGFKQVLLQDYISANEKSLSLEIYEMENPEGAFGIYTFQARPSGEKADVGNQGRMEGYYINFWKGPYLVTITGFEEDEETIQGIKLLAQTVASRIPSDMKESKPHIVGVLQKQDLVDGSLTYYKGPLGLFNRYPFSEEDIFQFKNGVSGEYDNGKRIFILAYPDDAAASGRYSAVKAKFRAMSRYENYAEQEGLFHMQDNSGTLISLTNRGKYLVILIGCENPAEARHYIDRIRF